MKRVGFNLEGIVCANTIVLWESYIEQLKSKGKDYGAAALRKLTNKLIEKMPLHEYLSTSPDNG